MTTKQELLQERQRRVLAAANLETPDRVPLVLMADSFCAHHRGVPMATFCTDVAVANRTVIDSLSSLGDFDGILMPVSNAAIFSLVWLANVKIPGRDLPADSLWQVDEAPLMTEADYDTIIKEGFDEFRIEYLATRLRDTEILPKIGAALGYIPTAVQNCLEAGIPVVTPLASGVPIDPFCGGRTLPKFFTDLRRMPDKVQEAMDVTMAETIASVREMIKMFKPMMVWVDGMRGSSAMVSPKIWQRFVWPYYRQLVQAIHEEGAKSYLHFDGDWSRDLAFFKELPKGSAVFASDHGTDLYKARQVLDGHLCVMGDVPAAMLAMGTPDEVYAYCLKLIRDLGPSGFILSQGCDIPPNAKVENVAAMMAAASGQ